MEINKIETKKMIEKICFFRFRQLALLSSLKRFKKLAIFRWTDQGKKKGPKKSEMREKL